MPDTTDERAATRAYYDDFAARYEHRRGAGYHRMVDDLEASLVRRYGRGADVLEVGCGTGLVLARVRPFARFATGVDVSAGMLAAARQRGLSVVQGSATALPYADASFDVAYAFKVLPHVVDIRSALAELARVTRPGGHVLAEFYNRHSLRYLIKRVKPPSAISTSRHDGDVFTRYDDLAAIKSYLPASLQYLTVRGIRVITPVSYAHDIPGAGGLLRRVEQILADAPVARFLGGFLVAIARKL